MMRKSRLFVPAFILLLAGCTDNMETITRELRNANNEAMDALMMVTSEQQAYRMNVRVFKPLSERYKAIEFKLKGWQSNREPKEQAEETFNSNGFYLYLAETETNRRRFAVEMTRLRNLRDQYVKRKLEETGEGDSVLPPDKVKQYWPSLSELIDTESSLGAIKSQLQNPAIMQIVNGFKSSKSIDNYDKLYRDLFLKKRALLTPAGKDLVY